MKNIYSIFKKEFDKIFKFPRAIFSTLILPGLIIFIVYFFIGNVVTSEIHDAIEKESIVYTVNAPDSLNSLLTEDILKNYVLKVSPTNLDLEDLKYRIDEGEIDVVLIYPENFDATVRANGKPEITIYYTEEKMNSSIAYSKAQSLLELQKDNFLSELEIDPNIINMKSLDVAKPGTGGAMYLSMIMPMLIISLIFSSALGIGSEAIAGEKERGTLAKLLLLPIKRNEIVGGKIMSTTIISILSGTSSFIGILASLPFMKDVFQIDGAVGYKFVDYLALFGLVIVLAAFASVLLLIISTFAKNIKEASAYATPLLLVAMFLPMTNMFSMGRDSSTILYLVPFYNITLGITDLLAMNMEVLHYLLIVGSNLVFISILTIVLIRMFRSENILFSK